MKLTDVQVGERYEASVRGRLIVMRVSSIRPMPSPPRSTKQQAVVLGIDETTGRRVTIRSVQNLRRPIEDDWTFSRTPPRRPGHGAFSSAGQSLWPSPQRDWPCCQMASKLEGRDRAARSRRWSASRKPCFPASCGHTSGRTRG